MCDESKRKAGVIVFYTRTAVSGSKLTGSDYCSGVPLWLPQHHPNFVP